MTKKITTALYDEKNLTREYFYRIFKDSQHINALFRANNETLLVDNLKRTLPDVLIMHMRPDKKEHRQLMRNLKKEFPSVRLLVLLINYEPVAAEIFNLISAGAKGIITDSYSHEDVLQALYEIALSGMHCNDICPKELFERSKRKNVLYVNEHSSPFFSERESRIIHLKKEGKTSAETGELLYISARTVDNILQKLYERFSCHSILELIGQYEQRTLRMVG